MKSLCLTLFLFCQTTLTEFDFDYSNNTEFVNGIIECTQLSNTYIPPHSRSIIIISVAQAALESDWGKSRFAQEGNNFYGIIETLKGYAVDPAYVPKLKATVGYLLKEYPVLFRVSVGA